MMNGFCGFFEAENFVKSRLHCIRLLVQVMWLMAPTALSLYRASVHFIFTLFIVRIRKMFLFSVTDNMIFK